MEFLRAVTENYKLTGGKKKAAVKIYALNGRPLSVSGKGEKRCKAGKSESLIYVFLGSIPFASPRGKCINFYGKRVPRCDPACDYIRPVIRHLAG